MCVLISTEFLDEQVKQVYLQTASCDWDYQEQRAVLCRMEADLQIHSHIMKVFIYRFKFSMTDKKFCIKPSSQQTGCHE